MLEELVTTGLGKASLEEMKIADGGGRSSAFRSPMRGGKRPPTIERTCGSNNALRGAALGAHQDVLPNPTREVILETDADSRLPRCGGGFDAYDYADGIRLHARRRMAPDEAHPCPNLHIHFRLRPCR
jgi:hypothetical protein